MASTASRLDIYNMALGFIGTRTVASPNEQTPEAIQCNLMWDRARRSVLRDFPYVFSTRRAKLPLKTMPAEYAIDWKYCYGTPSDSLKITKVFVNKERLLYKVVVIDNAEVIMANEKDAYCEYQADVENMALWDELFVMSVARKLACLIAVPLLKNSSEVKVLEELYRLTIPSAESHTATEGRELEKKRDDWCIPYWGEEEWR